MCGRYSVALDGGAILVDLDCDAAVDGFDWTPVYSVSPRTGAPVVRDRYLEDGDRVRELGTATWGLHPSWAKDSGPRPINARLETVATNGMFRGPFASGRVLVPMTGYYEWQEAEEDGKKVKLPSYIHHAGDEPLVAAGLMASREDEATGEWSSTFTIITRTGEDAAGEVHDRMPVFLPAPAVDAWSDPEALPAGDARTEMLDLLDAASREVAGQLVTRRVGRRVNSTRGLDRADPSLIAPLESGAR